MFSHNDWRIKRYYCHIIQHSSSRGNELLWYVEHLQWIFHEDWKRVVLVTFVIDANS